MNRIDECLDNAVAGKEISASEAKRLKGEFERFSKKHMIGAPATAKEAALKELIEELKLSSANKRRLARLAIVNFNEVKANVTSHRNAAGNQDIAEAAEAILEHFGEAKFDSVDGAAKGILAMAHSKISAMLMHFERSAVLGDLKRKNAADLTDMVRELFGADTGSAKAKEAAKAWSDTAEWLRQRFNAAGGAIGKLENWGLPQYHDALALRKRKLEPWKADIRPLLDLSRMKHALTGRPISEAELDGVLDSVFNNIVSEGWVNREPSRQAFGKGMLANQNAQHRFLVFKDADAWLAYQKNYGGGDPFAAMMAHVSMMSKDIAALEILGPNPDATVEWLKQAVRREAKLKAAGKKSLYAGQPDTEEKHVAKIEALWGSIRGALNMPVNSNMANFFAGGRNLVTAVSLGGAVLSSVTDVGTSLIARSFAGIGNAGFLPELVKAFSKATREEAVAAGGIFDSATHVFHERARYAGMLNGGGLTAFFGDRVLAYSGLTAWTQSIRHAFLLGFQTEVAVRAAQRFDEIDKALRDTFERYGFTADEWDSLSRVKKHTMYDGTQILRPAEIEAQLGGKLARRYVSMIHQEMEYAVPTGSHRAKTLLVNENRPGTLIAEVIRSFAQFKTFGAVIALIHGKRIYHMAQAGKGWNAAGYAAQIAISSYILGSLAVTLKDIAAGREPRDMGNAKFAGAALLQGGGLGIWGDFLFADINRYGGSMGGNMGGPLFEKGMDFWNLTAGNMIQLGNGEKTRFGRELTKAISSNVPGNNIWYFKLAWERVLMNNLQRAIDPEADKAFRRQIKQRQRDYGQEYWWAPGEKLPAAMSP